MVTYALPTLSLRISGAGTLPSSVRPCLKGIRQTEQDVQHHLSTVVVVVVVLFFEKGFFYIVLPVLELNVQTSLAPAFLVL